MGDRAGNSEPWGFHYAIADLVHVEASSAQMLKVLASVGVLAWEASAFKFFFCVFCCLSAQVSTRDFW